MNALTGKRQMWYMYNLMASDYGSVRPILLSNMVLHVLPVLTKYLTFTVVYCRQLPSQNKTGVFPKLYILVSVSIKQLIK